MINFLPPEAKIAVKREYVIRTLSVWALLLAVAVLVEVVLLLPTYVLLWGQLEALAIEVVQAETDGSTQAYQTARTELEKAHALALRLSVATEGLAASDVFREIQKTQPDSIILSGFSYEHASAEVETVEIRGIAETREALAEFSAALERNPLFLRADVPVSDLAEARDLSFTLSITMAQSGI